VAAEMSKSTRNAAARGAHDVGGLHVAVDDRWIVGVQVIQSVGSLGQALDHLLDWKARITLVVENLLQIRRRSNSSPARTDLASA
jgi:hypothetical protein